MKEQFQHNNQGDASEECAMNRALPIDLGAVAEVTLGSSASDTPDANSQYYWGTSAFVKEMTGQDAGEAFPANQY